MMKSLLLLALCLAGTAAHAQNAPPLVQNLNFSAALDVTAPIGLDDYSNNKLGIRSAEFMLYAPVDTTFEAMINFAAHNEDGEYHAEVHEGYISSSKLIPNLRFKLGMFFLGVGRLNQFHQHDWPFITAPKVQAEFFGDEGIHDTGLEFTYILPTDSYWDITFGVTDGYQMGEEDHGDHSHAVTERPNAPIHYIRPSTFIDLGDNSGLQIGLNYFGQTDAHGLQTQLSGLDFVYKKKEGNYNRWLFQSEIWNRVQNSDTTERSNQIGAYFYPEYGFNARWFAGLRVDAFTDMSLKFDDGEKRDNLDYAFVPTVSYKNSEFVTWRLAYTHEVNNVAMEADQINRVIELQFIAILGAHPAHAF
ncbi:hypothetical protein B9G69_017125 [Bdellovibrio sp. SKB1291214]|uniref:hypothetical protein n=1 Tax=Bdellovibrio sp. SKB1291214 TaxID=1732569 RepID=UPI0020CFB6DC|nr:hypothetical protein [Bdellovibrio sp. SKB1291214]UYL08767.1 hypothetical protein B9G69_017125 [Bdellovibrio sp. SKB1291214]